MSACASRSKAVCSVLRLGMLQFWLINVVRGTVSSLVRALSGEGGGVQVPDGSSGGLQPLTAHEVHLLRSSDAGSRVPVPRQGGRPRGA